MHNELLNINLSKPIEDITTTKLLSKIINSIITSKCYQEDITTIRIFDEKESVVINKVSNLIKSKFNYDVNVDDKGSYFLLTINHNESMYRIGDIISIKSGVDNLNIIVVDIKGNNKLEVYAKNIGCIYVYEDRIKNQKYHVEIENILWYHSMPKSYADKHPERAIKLVNNFIENDGVIHNPNTHMCEIEFDITNKGKYNKIIEEIKVIE